MICQSCDMPMSKDPQGGGRNNDGTLSDEYCSFCFEDGVFTFQGNDVRDFQKMVVNEMVRKGWWRPVAWLFTRRIPSLKRWKR